MDSHDSIRRTLAGPLLFVAALAAPACLAQEAAAPVLPGTDEGAGQESAEGEQPRSAFGQVMSLLVAALARNAETPGATPATDEATPGLSLSPTPAPATTPAATQEIHVGAKFRLGPAPLDQAPVAAESPLAANSSVE